MSNNITHIKSAKAAMKRFAKAFLTTQYHEPYDASHEDNGVNLAGITDGRGDSVILLTDLDDQGNKRPVLFLADFGEGTGLTGQVCGWSPITNWHIDLAIATGLHFCTYHADNSPTYAADGGDWRALAIAQGRAQGKFIVLGWEGYYSTDKAGHQAWIDAGSHQDIERWNPDVAKHMVRFTSANERE